MLSNLLRMFHSKNWYPTSLILMMMLSPNSAANTEIKVSIGESSIMQFQVLQDTFKYTRTTGKKLGQLPLTEFDIVIADDGRVIPSTRGLHVTQNEYWNIIFEPGSWYLQDEKVSVVLPFALIEKNANCTHQGIIIIENNTAGYQIASETCQYFQFNVLGRSDIQLTTKIKGSSDAVIASHTNERDSRLPEKSIINISIDYPALDPVVFSQPDYIESSSMSIFGAVINGTHYTSDCPTRASTFPDCSHFPLPAYSLSKSIIGGIGLMRLEALYPGTADLLVKDLIPECSAWGEITLSHLLNNTTGRYGSSNPHYDEDNHLASFLNKTSAKAKTEHACKRYRIKQKPGEQWVYHTTEYWLLGVAMQNFWRKKRDEKSDFYTDVLNPLWRELGLSPVLDEPHRQTGQPLTGWGLTLLRSDIAIIASMLSLEKSVFTRHLDQSMFKKAMQREPSDRGSVAGSETLRFQNGFWAWDASSVLECKEEKWLPFMSGYGGISVVLLPDGDVYYYFSDGGIFRFAEVIEHLNSTNPIC